MSASIKTEDAAAGAGTLAASAAAAPGTPAAAGGMPDALRDAIAKAVWDDILNEAVVEVLFDVHRLHKLDRSVCQVCHTKCRVFSSVPGQDVFGCNPSLTNGEKYDCPQCQNQLPAARYAPHLEKCLGLGRMSSRVANRKITAAADRQSSPAATGSVYGEGDSDTDRDTYTDKKKKRKTSPIRRSTVKKAKPGQSPLE
ncbi:hypothetical protein BC831DRAFT_291221 [Entophlyctis helioformis]|nr:hypothetical protein BC831DRAFT_291221 [Entophlyctis helioformis]